MGGFFRFGYPNSLINECSNDVILVSGILGGIFPHPIVISMLSGINQILICDKHQIPRSLIANHILGLKEWKYKSALANID